MTNMYRSFIVQQNEYFDIFGAILDTYVSYIIEQYDLKKERPKIKFTLPLGGFYSARHQRADKHKIPGPVSSNPVYRIAQ